MPANKNWTRSLSMAGQSDAIIYTIGIFDENDPDRNLRALKQLAKATGGEAFLPGSTKEVVPICKRIARDIRNQYSITYQSTNKKQDGSYRVIQVTSRSTGARTPVRPHPRRLLCTLEISTLAGNRATQ